MNAQSTGGGFGPLPPKLAPVAARLAAAGANVARIAPGLRAAASRVEAIPAKALLQDEDERMRRPRYLLCGWACRFTQFEDGRRQVFDVVLPGEGFGVCLQPRPLALTSVMAITPVELIDASDLIRPEALADDPALAQALERIADQDERRLLEQITRLGRMTALERLAHFLVQLHDRLAAIGATEAGRFTMPLTQELLADLLGLSTVHVNRTVQDLRRQGLVAIDRGSVHLRDRAALLRLIPSALMEADRASA